MSYLIIIISWGLLLNFFSFLLNLISFISLIKYPIGYRLKIFDIFILYEKGYIPFYTFVNFKSFYIGFKIYKRSLLYDRVDAINYLHYLRLNKNML